MEWPEKGGKSLRSEANSNEKGLVRRTGPEKASTVHYRLNSCFLLLRTKPKWGMCHRAGSMIAFTVCLLLCGLLLVARGNLVFLSWPIT